MQLKRVYEVTMTEHVPRRCVVLADDEREIPNLLPEYSKVEEVKRQPGLISVEGSSRIISWIADGGSTGRPGT